MKPGKKIEKKTNRRIAAHVQRTGESKVQQRWGSGGFPKPGSQNLRKQG